VQGHMQMDCYMEQSIVHRSGVLHTANSQLHIDPRHYCSMSLPLHHLWSVLACRRSQVSRCCRGICFEDEAV